MKRAIICFFVMFLILSMPSFIYANLGVGIGTGKIVVEDKLKSGIIYSLPSLTVANTGDEESDYTVSVAYHTDQKELKPYKDWFMFSPEVFRLKPGESKIVEVRLNLPLKTEPGSYFAYLEGSPVISSENGKSSVGIAAAAKLYFDIVPSNIFEAIYYRIISFFHVYSPWPQYVSICVVAVLGAFLLKKFLHIEVSLKKKNKEIKDD